MTKNFIYILCVLFITFSLQSSEFSTILSEKDFQRLEKLNSTGPIHMSASEDLEMFEAFMEWKCFNIDTVKLKCSKYSYQNGTTKFVPNIYVSLNGIAIYFGSIPEQNYSCEEVLPKWEMLLNGADQICLMSAALEGDRLNVFFYDIYSIKTNTGSWESKYFYEQK